MNDVSGWQKLEAAQAGLKKLCPNFPKVVVTLGSGLSGLVDQMEKETEFPFQAIPGVHASGVQGHGGRVVIGKLGRTRIAAMQGRLHYYEGLSMEEVVFPFRVFALAGADLFLLTNAVGGFQAGMKPLDLMLIRDHINLMGDNPLVGTNEPKLGQRFPDMSGIYDPELSNIFRDTAKRLGLPLREGVYVGILGPCYETPAEIRMFRAIGGDVVGMSTVPEAIALKHMGRKVVGISCVTNLAAGVDGEVLTHEDVLSRAPGVYGALGKLIAEALPLACAAG